MNAESSIKNKAISGAIWKFLERTSAQLVSMAVAIVLARLLEPDDYSVVGIVSVFFTFSNVLISGGFNAALIQKKNADEEDYSSVLLLSLLTAMVLYIGLFISAPAIATVYSQPILKPIIRVMGLVLPVNALKSIVCAYISSKLQFRKFFFATIGGTMVSAVVGIAMAYSEMGPWALVAQQMTNAVIDTVILCVTTRIHLCARVSFARIRTLFSYGWRIFASSILTSVYTEANPLLIGLKYSGADLAYYNKGRSFPSLITSTCNTTLSAVLFPVLSKFQDDKKELLRYLKRYIRIGSFIVFPAILGFAAIAENFVLLLLTEKWMPAAQYIRIFCLGELFVTLNSGHCQAVKALGRSDVFLKMEIIKKTGYFIVIAVSIMVTDSPVGLALATLVCAVIAVLVNCLPNTKLLGYGIKSQICDVMPSLAAACIMYFVLRMVRIAAAPALVVLIIQVLTGVIVYVSVSILFRNESLYYLWGYLKGKMGR